MKELNVCLMNKIMQYYFKQKRDEIIKHQKVEDIKIPKSSRK